MAQERLVRVGRETFKDRRGMPRAQKNCAPESSRRNDGGNDKTEAKADESGRED